MMEEQIERLKTANRKLRQQIRDLRKLAVSLETRVNEIDNMLEAILNRKNRD